ncbi:peptidoglycan-binding protein [Alicyclobacillus fodiniaquatilis]|uniref:Peptidoglycan-binding protein n=1 Tax=Alicyclobacillus fodiniaquatilis TaxID=1661150 RepID=A0ABW4JJT1_9BACL
MHMRRLFVGVTVPTLLAISVPVAAHAQTTEPTLKSGSTGSAVVLLQKDLNSLGYAVGADDGDFGPKTLAEVKAFQRASGLQVDGVVGPATWGAINDTLFTKVDLRDPAPSDITAQNIDKFLNANKSPMAGLGQSFIEAQNTYGVDANYLVSHAILESYWGESQIALAKNNLFGYGAYDSNPGDDAGMFPSDDYAIRFQAWEVRNNYLNSSGSEYVSPTLKGMNVNYATDKSWATSIGSLMNELASSVGSSVSAYSQYSPTKSAASPESTTEPVFYINGATGATQKNSYYGGVPYFSSMGAGMDDMFLSPLQSGSSGEQVEQVQTYLNKQMKAGLTVDGQFGPATEAAVKKFEAKQGLKQNGEWTFAMWQSYIYTTTPPTVPAGQSVEIDQIEQGMAGPYVVPWYHIANEGWVDSQYVKLTNVYRLTVSSPTNTNTSIPVYGSSDGTDQIATLHNGDFVVAQSASADDGMYEIQFSVESAADADSGQAVGTPLTGYVSASDATLTQQQ